MRRSPQFGVSEAAVALETPARVSLTDRETNGTTQPRKSTGEDLAGALFILLLLVLTLEGLFRAIFKGLWFDEVLTVLVSRQAHVSGMLELLKHGVDGHPPGMYVVEHVMAKLGGNDRITYRLAPLGAFVCVIICVYTFIRRRAGNAIALVAAGALLLTSLYVLFALEARPYSMMVACFAIALLCYERADSWPLAVAFAVALAAASSLHFLAVLSFFPFGLAELAYLGTERRFRPQVWLGFVAGILPYFAFWPVLSAQRQFYGMHFWAVPTFWRFAISMTEALQSAPGLSVTIFAAAIVYLVHLAYSGKISATPKVASNHGQGFSLPDVALAFGFLMVPAVTFAVAKIGHGGYAARYVITTTLGISLTLGLLLSRVKRPVTVYVGLSLICLFALQEGSFWTFARRPREVAQPMQSPALLADKLDVPLVISDALEFLPTWYQATDGFRSRLVFLADPEEEFSVSDNDSATIQMLRLKEYTPIQVQTFSGFARNHRKFLVLSNGAARDYRPRWLIQHGYSLHVIDIQPPVKNPIDPDTLASAKEILYFVDLDEQK